MRRRGLTRTLAASAVALSLIFASAGVANAIGTKRVGDYDGKSMYTGCVGPLGTANLCGFTIGPVPVSVQARVGANLVGAKVTASSGAATFWYYGSSYTNGGAGHWGGGNYFTT